jgi:rRNA maturation endonuclease Nob1
MADEPEHRVCERCGRRFARPTIVESGECPTCGGDLVPLEEAGEADESGGDHQGR